MGAIVACARLARAELARAGAARLAPDVSTDRDAESGP
jgi:hypothetical protein